MNKRDFYKELMKEYTFDSAKVRRNAKCPKKHKSWRYLPPTAAVAAITVLVIGLFAFFNNNANVPVMTGSERIKRANLSVEEVVSSIGNKNLYLSFNSSITFGEMQKTLDSVSTGGEIEVETLYILKKNNAVSTVSINKDPDELQRFKNDEITGIVGAKVSAPVMLIADLNQQEKVALLEIETDYINDNTFVPLAVEDGTVGFYSSELAVETTGLPHETTTPAVINETTETAQTTEADETIEDTEQDETGDSSDTELDEDVGVPQNTTMTTAPVPII